MTHTANTVDKDACLQHDFTMPSIFGSFDKAGKLNTGYSHTWKKQIIEISLATQQHSS